MANASTDYGGRRRVLHEECLYRNTRLAAIGIAIFGFGLQSSMAQMPRLKRPEQETVDKPAQPPPKKLVGEPRAVGVLQLNSSGKGTLIPIAIRIDGKFYDASVYKADPVPMALDVGTVYEVEKTGQSEGLFTVSGALHNQNPNSATQWLGAGSYVVNGSEPTRTIHRAEDKPRGIDDSGDGPPRLTRESQENGSSKPASPSPSATNPAPKGTDSADEDAGRPQLKRTGGEEAPGSQAGNKQDTTPTSSGRDQTPANREPNQTASAAQSGSANSKNGAPPDQDQTTQGYYRPTLRRGKPLQGAPEDTPDELMRTTETGIAKGTAEKKAEPAKAAIQLVPAISDAGGPMAQSYQFFWKQDEEQDRRKQMLDLAANEVRAYLARMAKDTIPAKPLPKDAKETVGRRGSSVHTSEAKREPNFENVQFRAFDVWKNNQPVMILTAEAHLPEAKRSETSGALPDPEALTYYITLVARTDIYGDLRKLYAGVTDKFHLDVTPKLELIDAVDADGDGRGELLFRETADAGNGYIIYRPTGDTLWKMFDSVNAE